MKKKLSIMLISLYGLMMFPTIANAAVEFKLTCNPDQPNYGETVNCQVSLVQSTTPLSQIRMRTTSYNLEVQSTSFATEATDPWSQPIPDTTTGFTTLKAKTVAGVSTGNVANIVAKVSEQGDDCGNICVEIHYMEVGSTVEVDGGQQKLYNTKVCEKKDPPPDVVVDPPPTGNFASYAILAGGAAIALATIMIAKKSTKFYRV